MGDVIDVARNIQFDCCGRISCTCYKDLPIKKINEIESRYFLRLKVEDRAGVLAKIADTLGRYNVSISQVIQKDSREGTAELVVITAKVKEHNFSDALATIAEMQTTKKVSSVIRVY